MVKCCTCRSLLVNMYLHNRFKIVCFTYPVLYLIFTLKMSYLFMEFLFLVQPACLSKSHSVFSLSARIIWVCLL